jgi:hypothetical protein
LKYGRDCVGGDGGGGGDGGEAVPGSVLIFTMLGGEEFVTGSALILVRTSALHFLLFLLRFSQYQLQLLIFPHFLLLLSLGHDLLQHLAHAELHVHPCHHGGGGASLGLSRGFNNSPSLIRIVERTCAT